MQRGGGEPEAAEAVVAPKCSGWVPGRPGAERAGVIAVRGFAPPRAQAAGGGGGAAPCAAAPHRHAAYAGRTVSALLRLQLFTLHAVAIVLFRLLLLIRHAKKAHEGAWE